MKIRLTDFGKRHFDKDFGGTKVLNTTFEDFEETVNLLYKDLPQKFDTSDPQYIELMTQGRQDDIKLLDGYAPFCKLFVVKNFTDARVGSLPLTNENYIWLKSGYSARRDSELPVLSRWLELPMGKPKAEWLVLVLYSYEQLHKEHSEDPKNAGVPFLFDGEWGIVAILGQSHPNEEPMKPETMIRNALGISEGGSGVPLNREKYLASVDFWSRNVTVK